MSKLPKQCHLALYLLFGFVIASPTVSWGAEPAPTVAGAGVQLTWLAKKPPGIATEVSWGVPWPRGAVNPNTLYSVRTAEGKLLGSQMWPLAYWPDGSLKWSGFSIVGTPELAGPLSLRPETVAAPSDALHLTESPQFIDINTGPLVCRISRKGSNLIDTLSVGGHEVGRNGRLIAIREDRSQMEANGIVRTENFVSEIGKVTVEQSGPIRAVVKIEGLHVNATGARAWLPFQVRLYFTAGLSSVRIVHSFVFDGEARTDYIRGLGMAFSVPFREELQNRHVRFAGDQAGIWGEPVLMSPGYREVLVKNAIQMNLDQLVGKRIPNLNDLGPKEKAQFETIALWDGFKLAQLTPDSFTLDKRTGTASSWLHIDNGHRARGFAFLGDVSGGLGVGIKRFWEKYPAALEIAGAATAAGELKVWFWSPDAPAMDLRHYDVVGHEGRISYEDHQEGFSTPLGVANTNELTLWATGDTPDNSELSAMADLANGPPLLVCAPEYYHDTRVLGVWSLPDRSTPDKAAMEEQLDRAFAFFHDEVEQRHWYGFWDYGDVMRTYDGRRHTWMYDIGGHAWNNTELMPNLWLWYSFLRTGRQDIFRFAEAMTRNTAEVDVYHAGRFAGLGSRHNVDHWGDGAKEARISEALLKRFYYYLTTDERTGDLMKEVLNVDQTIVQVQPLREELVRPDQPIIFRLAPDWEALASNWMTEWERTGDKKYRDYVLSGMKSIGALPDGIATRLGFRYDPETKQLFDIGEPNMKGGGFMFLFGGDQIAMELMQLIDCPEFAKAWNDMCEKAIGGAPGAGGYTGSRITAYVAKVKHDPQLGQRAWQELREQLKVKGRDRFPATPLLVDGSRVLEPVRELPALDTPGTSQWAINIITTMELARDFYVAPQKP